MVLLSKTALWSLLALSALSTCTPPAETHCYQSVTGEGDNQDVVRVVIRLQGENAEGSYDWVPAFKDRRMGTFKGTRKDSRINAEYTYSQEGTVETVPITLVQENARLAISGGPPELGLSARLPESDCAESVKKP